MPLNPKPLKIILLVLFITASILNSNAQGKGDPPSVKPGLEIKRSELIKRITESDSTMMFKRYGDVNGKPNFIGIAADKTSLQLVGEEDYLVLAKWNYPFTMNKEQGKQAFLRMEFFALVMGEKAGYEWLLNCAAEFIKAPAREFTDTKTFNFNRKGTFTYKPEAKALVLSFTEW
jgi:hypothetical protein